MSNTTISTPPPEPTGEDFKAKYDDLTAKYDNLVAKHDDLQKKYEIMSQTLAVLGKPAEPPQKTEEEKAKEFSELQSRVASALFN